MHPVRPVPRLSISRWAASSIGSAGGHCSALSPARPGPGSPAHRRHGSPRPSGWPRPAPAACRPDEAATQHRRRPASACWLSAGTSARVPPRAELHRPVGGEHQQRPRWRDSTTLTGRPQQALDSQNPSPVSRPHLSPANTGEGLSADAHPSVAAPRPASSPAAGRRRRVAPARGSALLWTADRGRRDRVLHADSHCRQRRAPRASQAAWSADPRGRPCRSSGGAATAPQRRAVPAIPPALPSPGRRARVRRTACRTCRAAGAARRCAPYRRLELRTTRRVAGPGVELAVNGLGS